MSGAPPFSGELVIDALVAPCGIRFGMVHMPGRNHVDGQGRVWSRNLADDLRAIDASGASALVTLVETHEFASLGVTGFATAASRSAFDWYHFPIPDMQPPGPRFTRAWERRGGELLAHIDAGRLVVVHCAGGLGRTGTLIAKLLVDRGMAPSSAIAAVRGARPGAIETSAQEHYVCTAARLPSRSR